MSYADPLPTDPSYARNPNILKWWTDRHDQLLLEAIETDQWIWYWSITDKICEITPKDTIEAWKITDPLCSRYAWYNILMYFAATRARHLGYQRRIRAPETKTCAICNSAFREDSIPPSVVRHLRVDQIDICLECINAYFGSDGDSRSSSKAEILSWIQNLVNELNIIPPQGILGSFTVLTHMSTEERSRLLGFADGKPSLHRVKKVFGSWLNALVQAGVLENDARETARGTQCIARDGHVCYSYGEKTIDDFLSARAVPHVKEPYYPGTNYRADFRVGTHFVEYFGLAGDKDYDRRAAEKQSIAKEKAIPLVSLYPQDLLSLSKLETILNPAIHSLDA